MAHVAAGQGSTTDRGRFEETLRKCAAAVGIDVKQSVSLLGEVFAMRILFTGPASAA